MKTLKTARVRVRMALAIGALAAGGLMISASGASAAPAGQLDEVRSVTYPGGSFYITDYVADKKGFFAEEGLSVKFIKPQSGVTAVQLMASGEIAFMINDGLLTMLAQSKGLGVTIIGSMLNRSLWTIYTADKNADLAGTAKTNPNGFKALKGKTIGVTGINAGTDLNVQSVLAAHGLDPNKDVKRIGIGLLTSAIGQFENGGIDAYAYYGPPADEMLGKNKLAHRFYAGNEADSPIASILQGGMVASTKWLNTGNNRDVARRWIAAQEKTIHWLKDPKNRQEASVLFAEVSGGTPEGGAKAIQELSETVYQHNLKGLKVPRNEFANTALQLEKLGLLSGKAPSYDAAIDKMGRE